MITSYFDLTEAQFKILFQNIQSIYNKQDILEAFLEQHTTYQALCISETWLSPEKLNMINLTNYKIAASYCRNLRTGGGVCILLKNHIEYIERKEISEMSIEYVLEICAIELVKEDILLLNLYFNGKKEDQFYEQLGNILNYVTKKFTKYKIILGGDFNINTLLNNNKTNKLLHFMLEYRLNHLINNPTRISKTTSTCLDQIFINFQDNNLFVTTEDFGLSDHMGNIVHLKLHTQNKNIIWYTEKRKFTKTNMDKYKLQLNSIDWSNLLKTHKDVNYNYNIFQQNLKNILDDCIPKKRITLKNKYKKHWLTTGIKKSCNNKRLLKILTIKSNNNEILSKYYKQYEKTLKKAIITSKKIHYINKIKHSNNKVKTMWHIIRERTNKVNLKTKKNIKLQINNEIITNPKQVADIFNKYFSSVGEAIQPQAKGLPVLNPSVNSIFLNHVELNEIYKLLKQLKNKTSHGIDDLPPMLFKHCAKELSYPLWFLINQSFNEGVFPDQLKHSLIKPIHKKNIKTDPTNYRPIALLPTTSKIYEKAIYDRIYKFCEKYNILSECQNGFRKNKSTIFAVYKYIQEIHNIINDKKYAIGILIDMTKAYDKVQYNILLSKLYDIGIRGSTHNLLKSYLHNRKQTIEIEYFNTQTKNIEKIRSDTIPVNASIPQGSVLGCLLFLIYINDFAEALNEYCVMFADDISILIASKDPTHLNKKLTNILNKTKDWLSQHNLQINLSKTKVMSFHPHQKQRLNLNFKSNFDGKDFEFKNVNEHTLLGLIIDTNVNWKQHIVKIHRKLSSFSYALGEIKKTTDLATAITTYYAYAYAWLSYGVILWGSSTDVPSLLTMQKKLIRIMANIESTDSCRPYFAKYKILTLPCIYIYEMCKFVRKHPSLFTKRDDNITKHHLRPRNKLTLPGSNIKHHSSSPLAMSIKIYNKLPDYLKNITNDKNFIKDLKSILLKKCYYSIKEFIDDKNIK